MKQKYNEWLEKWYREKYLPAYTALMLVYPFWLEDLEGEIWKWIKDYEGFYQISNFGRAKSFNPRYTKPRILTPVLHKNGYLHICLRRNSKSKNFSIHRLVAEAFIPNPENKLTVNHKDGNKFNNCVENLEWATSSENSRHAIEIGIQKVGEERFGAKLTEDQVREIRKIYIRGNEEYGAPALARKYGVHSGTIYNVLHGNNYKNVD